MELQDLQNQWQNYDRKLDESLRLNTSLLRTATLDRAGSALARLRHLVAAELLANLAVAGAVGVFVANHLGELRFLAPALLLGLGAILLIVFGSRQLLALQAIDYGAPVVAIQKRLQELRIQRIRTTKWILLLSPLLWTPLLIVSLQALLGLDAYQVLPRGWLAANLMVGVGAIPLLLWLSRRFAERFADSPLLRRLLDDIAGRNLMAATGYLSALARFEGEDGKG